MDNTTRGSTMLNVRRRWTTPRAACNAMMEQAYESVLEIIKGAQLDTVIQGPAIKTENPVGQECLISMLVYIRDKRGQYLSRLMGEHIFGGRRYLMLALAVECVCTANPPHPLPQQMGVQLRSFRINVEPISAPTRPAPHPKLCLKTATIGKR